MGAAARALPATSPFHDLTPPFPYLVNGRIDRTVYLKGLFWDTRKAMAVRDRPLKSREGGAGNWFSNPAAHQHHLGSFEKGQPPRNSWCFCSAVGPGPRCFLDVSR